MFQLKFFTAFCWLFVSTLMITGCKKDLTPVFFGYEYFGWKEGTFVEYEVTEIFHDAALVPANDTNQYILRTIVGEEYEDNEGRMARKYYRLRYDKNSGDLIDQRVWTSILDNGRGEVVEENQRKIRLVFAMTLDKSWDVNAFNADEEDDARYVDLHQSKNISGFDFDSTATVLYEDFFSLVDYRKRYDVYAPHVGLVQRSYKDLRINNFDTLNIQNGTEVHYRLLDYGKE